jgi:hypothetical protein
MTEQVLLKFDRRKGEQDDRQDDHTSDPESPQNPPHGDHHKI